jgi:hypothetical protein
MARPKRKKGLPKTTGEWAALPSDDVLRRVFGKRTQERLKKEGQKAAKPRKD